MASTAQNLSVISNAPSRGLVAARLSAAALILLLHYPLFQFLWGLYTVMGLGAIQSFSVPLVIAGLLYLRREDLGDFRPVATSDWRGLAAMIAASVAALVSIFAFDRMVPLAFTLPVCIHGYFVWTRGAERIRPFVLLIYLLVFLMPGEIGVLGTVQGWLQIVSAQIATWTLQGMMLPTWREGIMVKTGATVNAVTEGCSGMATFGVLLFFSLVFGFMFRLRPAHARTIVLWLVPASLGVNGLRVAFISYLLYTYGEKVANGPLHDGSGYVLFAVAYSVLYIFLYVFKKRERAQSAAKSATQASPTTP